ncbi:hypothetical protein P3X46_026797 [Hevea brasiliensis]|uniref:Reverse transcriptase zinc-binding domain-containing protein n=1 Tax=Hevea brasiliensis TaxID=3981 RepID=A0ABQ9KYY9_HEVBR|nr:hypothetical protein P3X46_026797 [Hevea brasiliensis]
MEGAASLPRRQRSSHEGGGHCNSNLCHVQLLYSYTVCKQINSTLANFWWGQKENEKRLHWIAWDITCKLKFQGGLGFRDIESFNLALLAKQGWRILSDPDSLLAQVLKGRYFPHTSFIRAKKGNNPSWGWQSLLWGRQVLTRGVRWQFSDGNSILCKEDLWIPSSFPNPAMVKDDADISINWASQLLNHNTNTWDISKLIRVYQEEEIKNILAFPISLFRKEDKIVWHFTNNGVYSVKSGYQLAYQLLKDSGATGPGPAPNSNNAKLWNGKLNSRQSSLFLYGSL